MSQIQKTAPPRLDLEIEELETREKASGSHSHTTARTCCTCVPLAGAPPAES